jgi:hypothetical protein
MTTPDLTKEQPYARPSGASLLATTLPPLTRERVTVLHWLLRLATAGAFIGHGAYGAIMEKAGWYPFLEQLGFDKAAADAHNLVIGVGAFEMALGVLALLMPLRALLVLLFVWKMGSEFIWYPLTDKPAWEFVERWSNYTAPLALLLVRGQPRTPREWFR